MAGFRGLGDRAHRTVARAGVVLGDPDDEAGDDEAEEAAVEQRAAVEVLAGDGGFHVAERKAGGEPDRRHRQDGGDKEALVHRTHDVRAAAEAYEVGADDRGDDAHAPDQQRERHQRREVLRALHEQGGEHHGGADGDDIGLEQVGGHAGAVTHVVAHVVGDHRRVARVILGDAGLDLADEVGADVGGLGEDPAAETREDRDQRGAERQRGEADHHGTAIGGHSGRSGQIPEEHRDREEREARHQKPGDGARAEGEGQALLEPRLRSRGGAHVRAHRNIHADEAGHARQHRTDREADGGNRPQRRRDDHGDDHAHDGNRGVLALEIGLCAFLDGCGDGLHLLVPGIRAENLAAGDEAIDNGKHPQPNRNEQ